jgi:hypothetical protein
MTPTNNFDRELTEAELERVVGGNTALQHETGHASSSPPSSGGITFTLGSLSTGSYSQQD